MGEEVASKPPRTPYVVVQTAFIAVLIGLSVVTRKFEQIFNEMEMKDLPLPTETFLALSRFVVHPVGLAVVVGLLVVLATLAWRGVLDRHLKRLLKINILSLALLIPFWVLSIYMPIVKIRQALSK